MKDAAKAKLPPHLLEEWRKSVSDFRNDHEKVLQAVREFAKVPHNRYFSVTQSGEVKIDYSRKREVELKKLSKSDSSE